MKGSEINIVLAAQKYLKKVDKSIDTVEEQNKEFGNNYRGNVLNEAFNLWSALEKFRNEATRNERFVFGDQWGDIVYDHKNKRNITEREFILQEGNQPLKFNILRNTLRTVTGIFTSNETEPMCIARKSENQSESDVLTATLQFIYNNNNLKHVDLRQLEWLFISGCAVYKQLYCYQNRKLDVWNNIVNPYNFFFDNTMDDPRFWDCKILGEFHDLDINTIIGAFSGGDKSKADSIREEYSFARTRTFEYYDTYKEESKNLKDFYFPNNENQSACRVFEIWKRENKACWFLHDHLTAQYYPDHEITEKEIIAENKRRTAEQTSVGVLPENLKLIEAEWGVDDYWYYYFLTPTGYVLQEGKSPYWFESHPYTFCLHNFFNGRIHPYISDFIDFQMLLNRILIMQDMIRRTSAKGVLMFPEECLPDDMSMEDISETWASYRGIIYYKPKAGVSAPQQVIVNQSATGAYQELSVLLGMLQDSSGIYGALQGKSPGSGTPARLYQQQTENSTTSLNDLFKTFQQFREERDKKNLQLAQQYYDEAKYVKFDNNSAPVLYTREKVSNVEFDNSIIQSSSTPAFQLSINDTLLKMIEIDRQGIITVKDVLEAGTYPFKDKLLTILNRREQEMQQQQALIQQGQQAGGALPPEANIPPELLAQIEQQAAMEQQGQTGNR
jgi:hypothetical protein